MRAGHAVLILLLAFAGILAWQLGDRDGPAPAQPEAQPQGQTQTQTGDAGGPPMQAPPPPKVPLPEGEWAGSARCAECHPAIYERWKKTAHARTLQDMGPGVSAKPFDGAEFEARGIWHTLGPDNKMEAEGPGGGMDTFDVDMVIGVRRVQMFTTMFSRGAHPGASGLSRGSGQEVVRLHRLHLRHTAGLRRPARHVLLVVRPPPQLQQPLRALPHHGLQHQLRPGHGVVRHEVDRARGIVRVVPRTGRVARSLLASRRQVRRARTTARSSTRRS